MTEQPDRTGAVIVEGTKDHQIYALIEQCNRMARDLRHADAERDAAQTALGLASEEVRELRAEVERLKEELEDDAWAMKLRASRAEVERLEEQHRQLSVKWGDEVREVAALKASRDEWQRRAFDARAVRITPSGEAVRLASTESEHE